MNPEAEVVLAEILKLSPEQLTEDQIGFLRARRSYLKTSQVEEYKSVLETKPAETQTVKQNAKSSETK